MNNPSSKRFLAEWISQEAIMLAWPHQDTDWAPWLSDICESYVELTQAISESATPLILCKDLDHQAQICKLLGNELTNRAKFHICPYNDTWCRDYGPISVGTNHTEQLINFQFTGWGNKYEASSDNLVNNQLDDSGAWEAPLSDISFDLEGGGIETDGHGTLLTTEHCLLNGNRNQAMPKQQVNAQLERHLGVDRIIWFSKGYLIGDDTDSHVDNLVRFASPNTLIYASCDDPDDPHYEPLKAMEQEVLSLKKADNSPYSCIPLAIPEAIYDENGTRLPASYVNFLILNDTVIAPTFSSSSDENAIKNLKQAFPKHRIITINGLNLIKQYGGPHCATMQLPKGTLRKGFLTSGEHHA